MCGIAGFFNRGGRAELTPESLDRMLGVLDHRGPESAGLFIDDRVALGHARLSIIDLAGGGQPLTNEDESVWLVCNGEVFNYVELRAELEARGHRFKTRSDCETILHLYEERGADCVQDLNGQFAFALWDRRRRQLLLGRDRLGICPLYYAEVGGLLAFASEIKALLTLPQVSRELDPVALGEVFTTWSPLPPRTMFKQVSSLRPGHVLTAGARETTVRRYWGVSFPDHDAEPGLGRDESAERLRELLLDATRLRLRADVPVGAYLSGGLDSAAVTTLARRYTTNELQTFSIAFADGEYDERPYQEQVARALGTRHHTIVCGPEDIARALPEVIWHTETPLLRTAPVPLFLLSGLVRRHGFKVVLTGEGSDEFLVGYDIFKETKVRAFWARQPGSKLRPRLLRRLYGHIPEIGQTPQSYLEPFFRGGLDQPEAPGFSHQIRWNNTRRTHRFLRPEVQAALAEAVAHDLAALQADQNPRWDPVARAQYNEITTFLEPYLLCSQGDRVAMAHAVEGRVPFLDHRVVEFCNSLPSRLKMPGLHEKALLKHAMAGLLPREVVARPKQPFRAPIRSAFMGPEVPDYVRAVLDPGRVAADGMFKPEAVAWLLDRAQNHARLSEVENMALIGMISFGLFKQAFGAEFAGRARRRAGASVVADYRSAAALGCPPEYSLTR